MNKLTIRKADTTDIKTLYALFLTVIEQGNSFMHETPTSKEDFYAYWFHASNEVYVALLDDAIVGSYWLKPNQPGRGSHVANASYMVDSTYRGQEIGLHLGKHSITEAKRLKYQAMQFNAVVSTNEVAIRLWKKLGFRIVGTNPKAFQHQQLGLVDTYVMYRELV